MTHLFYIAIIVLLLLTCFFWFRYMNSKTYKVFDKVDTHLTSIIQEQEKLNNAFQEFKREKEIRDAESLNPKDNTGIYKMGYKNFEGVYVENDTADSGLYEAYYEKFSVPDYYIPTEEEYFAWFYKWIEQERKNIA